jgi:organic radical activating enzyme
MTLLRLNRLHYPVTTLGPGVRAGIWVQGCPIGCRGCMATDTWVAGPQHEIAIVEVLNWLTTLGPFDGVTISGGEPFEQPVAVGELIDGIRQARPAADILERISCHTHRQYGRKSTYVSEGTGRRSPAADGDCGAREEEEGHLPRSAR